jgi:hypothetical protein
MKTLVALVLCLAFVSFPVAFAQSSDAAGTAQAAPAKAASKPDGCTGCAAGKVSSHEAQETVTKLIPGSNETMVVGRVENLIPIGVLTVLGCEKCSAEAVNWALQQGSSFEDIERTLRTVAAMQKLDCFKAQFGPEVATRMEKPLSAAKEALEQAKLRAAK